jgi:hypothetical protein
MDYHSAARAFAMADGGFRERGSGGQLRRRVLDRKASGNGRITRARRHLRGGGRLRSFTALVQGGQDNGSARRCSTV